MSDIFYITCDSKGVYHCTKLYQSLSNTLYSNKSNSPIIILDLPFHQLVIFLVIRSLVKFLAICSTLFNFLEFQQIKNFFVLFLFFLKKLLWRGLKVFALAMITLFLTVLYSIIKADLIPLIYIKLKSSLYYLQFKTLLYKLLGVY